jgi:DNA repair protein RadA/Sms
VQIGMNDIYLNVAGGLRISEPAADLAVAAALVSALTEQPVAAETVVFGEIGLSGEVRPVGQAEARLKEASKLGFAAAFVPPQRSRGKERAPAGGGVMLHEIRHLRELIELFEDQPHSAQRSAGASPHPPADAGRSVSASAPRGEGREGVRR